VGKVWSPGTPAHTRLRPVLRRVHPVPPGVLTPARSCVVPHDGSAGCYSYGTVPMYRVLLLMKPPSQHKIMRQNECVPQ